MKVTNTYCDICEAPLTSNDQDRVTELSIPVTNTKGATLTVYPILKITNDNVEPSYSAGIDKYPDLCPTCASKLFRAAGDLL